MKTIKEKNYTRIVIEDESITNISSDLTKRHDDFKHENVVIDILKFKDVDHEHLLSFLELSDRHRMEKKSFVIATDAVDIDKIPDELIVVPTITEAEDIIQMEEIERDLED